MFCFSWRLVDGTIKDAQRRRAKAAPVGFCAAVSLYSLQVKVTFSETETTLLPHLDSVFDHGKTF